MKKNFLGGLILGANLILAVMLMMGASTSATEVIEEKKTLSQNDVIHSSEPFLGQVILFGGNFAPRGWAFCHGQLLPISSNTALFAILGTTYGGDGRTTFGLPDLRGRVPVGQGRGPGLSEVTLGRSLGLEKINISIQDHPIDLPISHEEGDVHTTHLHNHTMSEFDNRQPSLGMNYIIALEGTFPSRS